MDAFPDFRVPVISLIEGMDGTIVLLPETLNSGTQTKGVSNIEEQRQKTVHVPHLFLFFRPGAVEKVLHLG